MVRQAARAALSAALQLSSRPIPAASRRAVASASADAPRPDSAPHGDATPGRVESNDAAESPAGGPGGSGRAAADAPRYRTAPFSSFTAEQARRPRIHASPLSRVMRSGGRWTRCCGWTTLGRRARCGARMRMRQALPLTPPQVRIYEGQLAVLGRGPERESLSRMADHERAHLSAFRSIVPEYRTRPSALLPLWEAAGYALGAASALLGKEAAYAATVAVETAITAHYDAQLTELQSLGLGGETTLVAALSTFRDEEQGHLDEGLARGAERAPLYGPLTAAVGAGCRAAIWITRRV